MSRRLALLVAGAAATLFAAASTSTHTTRAAAASAPTIKGCLARRLPYIEDVFEPGYTRGCTGHDEPELDPLSNAPGTARNLIWTVVLPRNGGFQIGATGPTFWVGGTVTDPQSVGGQAFVELQFYPNSVTKACTPNGGYRLTHVEGAYTVCSPVWSLIGTAPHYKEPAAFNAMLELAGTDEPLVMHEGDTVQIHYYATAARDGAHFTVSDLTTGQQGTIVLDSPTAGPLMPAFSRQSIGNSLVWGAVHDAPNAFVWEIGHYDNWATPSGHFCVPGDPAPCESYNAPAWKQTTPIELSVSFPGHGASRHYAVVSDWGGKAEVTNPNELGSKCTGYGGPFCIYPWYTQETNGMYSFGVDTAQTAADFGKVDQYQQTTACGSPLFGPDSTYCMTRIK